MSLIPNKATRDTKSDKVKALDLALMNIEKSFGKGAIMKLGDDHSAKIPSISTGCLSLDLALGIGGIPKGRIIEIFGPESSGKTTLTLHMAAECQKTGGTVAFIDAEHALDVGYAQNLGLNISDMLISQPDSGEQSLEITDMLVRSGAVDLLIIDSVAALTPRAELEGDMGDSHMGLQARLMSQALRKLTASISRSNSTVIFINQLRQKIGVIFGNPETTTGGNALKFYSSVRIDIRKTGPIKVNETVVGGKTRIKVVKNKVAPPFREVEVDIMYGSGISREADLLDLAVTAGLIDKSGAWYTYKEDKMGQGRESAKEYLRDHPETMKIIYDEILAQNGIRRGEKTETTIIPEDPTEKIIEKTKKIIQ